MSPRSHPHGCKPVAREAEAPRGSLGIVPTPDNADKLTYEQARDELVAIVAKLEAGAATLDESLALWERGEVLAVRCQTLLEGARARVADLRAGAEETPGEAK